MENTRSTNFDQCTLGAFLINLWLISDVTSTKRIIQSAQCLLAHNTFNKQMQSNIVVVVMKNSQQPCSVLYCTVRSHRKVTMHPNTDTTRGEYDQSLMMTVHILVFDPVKTETKQSLTSTQCSLRQTGWSPQKINSTENAYIYTVKKQRDKHTKNKQLPWLCCLLWL